MKILHIVPLMSAAAEYGGPARGTMRQAEHFPIENGKASVLSLWRGKKPPERTSGGVTVVTFAAHRVPFSHRFGGLISVPALLWGTRNFRNFDIVHVHAGRELWVLCAMILLRLLNIPYVVQTHGMLSPRSTRLHRLYDRLLTAPAYRGAQIAFYLTNFERRELSELGWFKRLELVVNGVDSVADSPPPNLASQDLRVVTTARIHPRKHVPDLVEAVAAIHDGGTPVSLRVFGPDEGDLRNVLERIRKAGAGSYIEYGGALSYNQVRDVLDASNVYVLPSRAEPFPNSLLEALSRGLACVCTKECGLSSYIEGYEAGIVVEPGVTGILGALEVLQDPDVRARFSARALELSRREFSMGSVVSRLGQLYTEASISVRR